MLVALTPRQRAAQTVGSALTGRTLTDMGSPELILAADSPAMREGNNFLWCVGSAAGADHCLLSQKQLLQDISSPRRPLSESLRCLQGAFGGLLYDATQKRAVLFSDRLALMPVYVACRPDLLLVGDCLGKIVSCLGEPVKVNEAGWAQWLTLGFFLGAHTPFAGIQRLEPGQWWSIDAELAVRVERFAPLPASEAEELDRAAAISALAASFQGAVERIAHANSHLRLLVPLSGGWDSRLIAGALHRAEIPFESVTTSWDSGNDWERIYAAKVAAHLGVSNTYYELPPDYYLQVRERYLEATDYGSVLHPWQQSFVNQLPAAPPALILDGYAGDLLLRGFRQPQPPTAAAPAEPAKDFYEHYRLKYGTEHLLARPARRLIEHLARQSLQTELGPEPTAPDHLRFLFHNRNRRNIALGPLRILSQKAAVAFPFLDPEFLDPAWRLPAAFRFDPTFYPELLDRIFPGLGQIPSSNSVGQSAGGRSVPVHKQAPEVIAFFRQTLERHPEDLGQLLDPEVMGGIFERVQNDSAGHLPAEFNRLEMAAHFAQWLAAYTTKLRPVQFLETGFASQANTFNPQFGSSPQILIPSALVNKKRRWQTFQKLHGAAKPKLSVLLTMDVEAFAPGDIYAAHTSQGDAFERLVLGRFPNQSSILEDLYTARGDLVAPWTLFIEMGARWRFGEYRLAELAQLLRGSPHEIALHLHPFSLPRTFYEARALAWNSYRAASGFARILQEVAGEFNRIWGFAPVSYRSGRFDVYEGHFQALAACGLRTDSSLYQHSTDNHSREGHAIANRVGLTPEGILELPVTTYLDRRDPKPGLHPTKLDLDFTPIPVVFELLARAQAQGAPAVVLLAHSWSFAQSFRPQEIGKVVHFAPSPTALEKLKWIVEFGAESPLLSFATCGSFYEKTATQHGLHGHFAGLIEINGDPNRCATASADRFTAHSHPWHAMHPAVTVSHPAPNALVASWPSFQPEDALYLELLGGSFFEGPSPALSGPVRLENAREIFLLFRHEACADVDLLVFFMQYGAEGRVRNESQTVAAAAEARFATLAFAREPVAATFKIAIKLLPRNRRPGWVRLDGFQVQRQT